MPTEKTCISSFYKVKEKNSKHLQSMIIQWTKDGIRSNQFHFNMFKLLHVLNSLFINILLHSY